MAIRTHRTIRILFTAVVLAAAVFVACNRTIFVMGILYPMFRFTLASMIVVLFSIRPNLKDAFFVVCLTVLHGVVAYLLFYLPYQSILWPAFAGLSSFWVLCIRTIWSNDLELGVQVYATISAVLLLTVESGAATVLNWTERLHPKTLDLFLYSFDGSLGTQFSFLMGQAFAKWPLFRITAVTFYSGLPVAIALICAQQIAKRKRKGLSAVAALVFTGPIGVIFYNFFPALGPRLIAQLHFPFQILTRAQTMTLAVVEVAAPGPRNAIPSLHMAWVLLIWWYSRGMRWWIRGIAMLFLIFTVAATMGSGEHYFVDLVVGIPFAAFIEALFSLELPWRDRRRIIPLAWGLGSTLIWLALLRFENPLFWISPIVPWGLVAATILFTWFYERGLQSAAVLPETVLSFGLSST